MIAYDFVKLARTDIRRRTLSQSAGDGTSEAAAVPKEFRDGLCAELAVE